MPRVVIDTNVIVKGLFVKGSKQDKILRLVRYGRVRVFYSLEMMGELLRVIDYPKIRKSFWVDMDVVERYMELVKRDGKVVVPAETILCRDAKDNMVLGTAMAAGKFGLTYLVTEDEDLLAVAEGMENVEVVTPKGFWELAKSGRV